MDVLKVSCVNTCSTKYTFGVVAVLMLLIVGFSSHLLAAEHELKEQYFQNRLDEGIRLFRAHSLLEAERTIQDCLTISRDRSDRRAAMSQWLGLLYYEAGNYPAAEQMFLQAVRIFEDCDGQRSYTMTLPMCSLASLYKNQGRYKEAEQQYTDVLSIRTEYLGKYDRNTLYASNELANFYTETKEFDKAEQLFRKCLEKSEDEKCTIVALKGIGGLLVAEGKFAEAEKMYCKAIRLLRVEQKQRSEMDLANSLNSLGYLYETQKQFGKAEQCYLEQLQVVKKVAGSCDPAYSIPLTSLGSLFKVQGRISESEKLYQEALSIRIKVLGQDHPHTASSMTWLASLYQTTGDYSKAESLYKRALEIRLRKLGSNNPDTIDSKRNLQALRTEYTLYPVKQRIVKVSTN